jgi:hypothetical protein
VIVTRMVAKLLKYGGPERDRTAGLLVANEALSQLSYRPIYGWLRGVATSQKANQPHLFIIQTIIAA